MRGRHLLSPLLSPLAYPKPPSSRLAPRRVASHRTVAPPPAARRAPLSEPDVGISLFASALPGFRGALKQRYSDFVVHEVALDGSLVRLTSFDLPDGEEVHDFFKRNFEALLTDTVEHSDGIQRCIRVRLKPGRRERRDVDGRGRNRKGTGSSGWRDDKPFDSRGSIIWPDHLGKFIRLCHLFHLYKENKDTQEALGKIGKMLGLQPRSFGFAGTKDKRAVTTQQVSLSVVTESEDVIKAALDGLITNGFINYYGLQVQ
ncbi:Os01g0773000 [Oryza sativa Japonica Group]|uniref:Os01g0773000 protein n=1 Tax=Oryza sativa subsp. japonica TaxID=39947 RepID=Q0JIW7_ORYSJ|nr:Os01g0773000 [Oryza sativa Japonica Group]|eukprot:NP_001044397.2 Os01g0773000 [Oryza sativa Japonica Group]